YLRKFADASVEVYSAGIEAHGLNPHAVASMARDGVDISGQKSTLVDEYAAMVFDVVLTVCDNAQENCPILPSKAGAPTVRLHHSFPDPAKAQGTPEEIQAAFDSVRDQIKAFSKSLLNVNPK
ncbi:MAG: arsenate reductase ArsC, partial [Bacteroidetes bacterium]|nr:arsenate reductase ArsC [Bacteroidota bacterium]